jgi:hypothetical protein
MKLYMALVLFALVSLVSSTYAADLNLTWLDLNKLLPPKFCGGNGKANLRVGTSSELQPLPNMYIFDCY